MRRKDTIARSVRTVITLGGTAVALAACSSKDTRQTADIAGGDVGMKTDSMTAPHAMAQANPQMQSVLDQLQSLKPKPLPTLTAAEARQQPTPADAAK